jgi:hypothetical protein
MSEVGEVVNGLTGANGWVVFIALILVGVYFLFKQTFGSFIDKAADVADFFIKNVSEQLGNISDEVKKTREALIAMQQSQIHFDDRLGRVEEDVKRIKPL